MSSKVEGWIIFSTRLKSALTCHKKFLWGSLSFKDTCLLTISVSFFSHVKNLHHHHWNVLKLFLDCDNFHVPIFCSLIVLSGYYSQSLYYFCFIICFVESVSIKVFSNFGNSSLHCWVVSAAESQSGRLGSRLDLTSHWFCAIKLPCFNS